MKGPSLFLGGGKHVKGGVLPAYCDPPNPCPKGYTAEDGCIEVEEFENRAEFSRKYQVRRKNIETTTVNLFAYSGFTELHVWLGTHVFLSGCQLIRLDVQKPAGSDKSKFSKKIKLNLLGPRSLWTGYFELSWRHFKPLPFWFKASNSSKEGDGILRWYQNRDYSHIYNQHQHNRRSILNLHQVFIKLSLSFNVVCLIHAQVMRVFSYDF